MEDKHRYEETFADDDVAKVCKVFKSLRKEIGSLKKGESKKVQCPLCGAADMSIGKSAYNGHLHIGCDGCGFYIVQ